MFEMKDEYFTGVEVIDEQHSKLIEIAEMVYQLLQNEFMVDKFDQIVALLKELKEYTIYHFATEEEYMEKNGYVKLFAHRLRHREFIKKLESVDFEHMEENQEKSLDELLNFLVNWLVDHIINMDKKMVEDNSN